MLALAPRTEDQRVKDRQNVAEDNSSERRLFMRLAQTEVVAEAKRLDHNLSALRQPRLSLAVRDMSVNGMSALSEQPVARGEHVGVRITNSDGRPGWGAYGRVVRCEPTAMGYRVAVEFDPLPAA
jgi:hypothetical protein